MKIGKEVWSVRIESQNNYKKLKKILDVTVFSKLHIIWFRNN